jgi:peptidoglycan-N-acetylglucosamine deacetylase
MQSVMRTRFARGLLRWSLVLAPVVVTATWVRATSVRAQENVDRQRMRPLSGVALPVHARPPSFASERTPPPLGGWAFGSPPGDQANVDPCASPEETLPRPAREVFMGPATSHAVALTFDDGPSRENTPRILETLARHEIRATFFVLGDRAEQMPDLLHAIDAHDHEIGNHGYSHGSLRSMWPEQVRDEVCRTQRAVESATGRRTSLFRPPFGRYPPSAVELLGGLGYDVILWSVDAEDWRFDDAETMARAVVDRARAGSIILLHDRESITARALPSIVDGLRRKGLDIVAVSELMASR